MKKKAKKFNATTVKLWDKWEYEIYAEKEGGYWYGCWRDLEDDETGGSSHPDSSIEEAIFAARWHASIACGHKHNRKNDPEMEKMMRMIRGEED